MNSAIISTALIEDLLVEVDPDLEKKPEAFSRALVAMLRPALNQVVKACRTPAVLADVIERQRNRVGGSRTTAEAFELFVANMMDAGDINLGNEPY